MPDAGFSDGDVWLFISFWLNFQGNSFCLKSLDNENKAIKETSVSVLGYLSFRSIKPNLNTAKDTGAQNELQIIQHKGNVMHCM